MIQFSFWDILSNLLIATQWTLVLSLIAFVSGGIVGLILLFMRTSQIAPLGWFTKFYIEFFQGTPLLMQLFLFFFGIALFGIEVSPWLAAWLALTFWTSAFLAEIWRGCVEAIPRGQWEASSTLALSYIEQMRYVDPAAGNPHRHRADRRFLGAGDQGHRARVHYRLRRTHQGRHLAQQRDFPAVSGLFAGGVDLFLPVLPAVLVFQETRGPAQ